MTERLHFHFALSCIGEGNGNPLQCSCLENPRDRGALWAAVYGVAQSWTRLKRLSSSSSITKYHIPGGLNSRNLFLYSSEGQKSNIKVQHGYSLERPLFLLCRWLPFHCVLTWQREECSGVSFCKGTNSIVRALLMSSSKFTYFPQAPSPKPSFWRLGCQYMNMKEGTIQLQQHA